MKTSKKQLFVIGLNNRKVISEFIVISGGQLKNGILMDSLDIVLRLDIYGLSLIMKTFDLSRFFLQP